MAKSNKYNRLALIIGIGIILIILVYHGNNTSKSCDSKALNTDPACTCPTGAVRESYSVTCTMSPCPSNAYYRCKYSECKVNSDCPGNLCSSTGKCVVGV